MASQKAIGPAFEMVHWSLSRLLNSARVGLDALCLHIYAVVLAVRADDLGGAAIQVAMIYLRHSAYLPIVYSALGQHSAAFGSL